MRTASQLTLLAVAALSLSAGNEITGYLGIGSRDIDAESAKQFRLPEEFGVLVTSLVVDSPAAAAGLRKDDVVVQFNGLRVEGEAQIERMIRETPPGREVRIVVYRNGHPQSLVAKIGSPPPKVGPVGAFAFPMPGAVLDIPSSRMSFRSGVGAEWEAVDGQLGSYFGARDGGVLVRSVMGGSAAERGGLRAGDVIIRIGDTRVTTPTDITARMRAERSASVSVTVLRDHRELGLTIMLDGSRAGQ